MGRYVKQVYFSTETERDLIEKARTEKNFSRYVKELMKKDSIFNDIKTALADYRVQPQQEASEKRKVRSKTLKQFL